MLINISSKQQLIHIVHTSHTPQRLRFDPFSLSFWSISSEKKVSKIWYTNLVVVALVGPLSLSILVGWRIACRLAARLKTAKVKVVLKQRLTYPRILYKITWLYKVVGKACDILVKCSSFEEQVKAQWNNWDLPVIFNSCPNGNK